VYEYDPVSGVTTVTDTVPEPDVVQRLVWAPQGTLARWNDPQAGYDRVFSYDEEGRLLRIELDYGNGNVQLAYEYGYSGDGERVWMRSGLNQWEYRNVCGLRVYHRRMGDQFFGSFFTVLFGPTFRQYDDQVILNWVAGEESFNISQTAWYPIEFVYMDRFFNIYYHTILPSDVPKRGAGYAEWREMPKWGGIAYDHAWIQFSKPCVEIIGQSGGNQPTQSGNKNQGKSDPPPGRSFGFWAAVPDSELWKIKVPGKVESPDPYEGKGKVVAKMTDPECVLALCVCVLDSQKNPPSYIVGFYMCGSWVADMWACAEKASGIDCNRDGFVPGTLLIPILIPL